MQSILKLSNGCCQQILFTWRQPLKNCETSLFRRQWNSRSWTDPSVKRMSAFYYALSGGIFMMGVTYSSVPLYRRFCQQVGGGGSSELARGSADRLREIEPLRDRPITVRFTADTNTNLKWNFRPQQESLTVVPGETALAFYTATNPTDKSITGIATYNIIPAEAAKYFNKIQCFCFEEQRLNPHEQVDMPVFFFLDTDFDKDPRLRHTEKILLSYTFFEAKEGLNLPLPGYATN